MDTTTREGIVSLGFRGTFGGIKWLKHVTVPKQVEDELWPFEFIAEYSMSIDTIRFGTHAPQHFGTVNLVSGDLFSYAMTQAAANVRARRLERELRVREGYEDGFCKCCGQSIREDYV